MGHILWGRGGDGYRVHGVGLGWGSVSVPVHTSNVDEGFKKRIIVITYLLAAFIF